MKIAVCVHLYHHDMWEEIQKYLTNIEHPYKLYINICGYTPNQLPSDFDWKEYLKLHSDLVLNNISTKEKSTNHFLRHGIKEKRFYKQSQIDVVNKIKEFKDDTLIIKSPNKGMDIGGFLYTYKHVDKDTDIILKLHTKKGLGGNDNRSNMVLKFGEDQAKRIGERWFTSLMNGVLKNKNQVNKIINEFKENPKCGMVGFKLNNNFHKNIKEIKNLYPFFNMKEMPTDPYFVGGTSFWVSNEIMKKYFTDEIIDKLTEILPEGYVSEPSPNHAMERIFGCVVYNEEKEIKIII